MERWKLIELLRLRTAAYSPDCSSVATRSEDSREARLEWWMGEEATIGCRLSAYRQHTMLLVPVACLHTCSTRCSWLLSLVCIQAARKALGCCPLSELLHPWAFFVEVEWFSKMCGPGVTRELKVAHWKGIGRALEGTDMRSLSSVESFDMGRLQQSQLYRKLDELAFNELCMAMNYGGMPMLSTWPSGMA